MSVMTLSEAIRLGAMLYPQRFKGDGITEAMGGAEPSACAGIAAAIAAGCPLIPCDPPRVGRQGGLVYHDVEWPRAWIDLFMLPAQCPECAHPRYPTILWNLIHLNDDHRWTRERIADWVETIEPKVSAPVTQEVVHAAQ